MSKVFAGYHIVFATKQRRPTLATDELRRKLYHYIYGFMQTHKCFTYRIGGIHDHVHIAIDLNPTISLSELMRDLKRATSNYLSPQNGFYDFAGWGKGYYAGTFSYEDRLSVIEYVKNQYDHHCGATFEAEMEWFALKSGFSYHPDDMN